ncbi:hypothetical protein CDL12_07030 [Handroanthus impetiginosus]|uniref:Sec-independent protein translocase protein TATB, chloroplastic n=1 Tax=Handroanthus impetiginosus TaxID=429701 RepID=A0A2G9HRZ3_9LAMI|nr:hypothetical protein CDL12_07030 [Handroanthus impetiginosus]
MLNVMAFAISIPTSSLRHSSSSSSSTGAKVSLFLSSNSAVSIPRNGIFHHFKCVSQLGFSPFPQWNGLKQLGFSISQFSVKRARKGKCRRKGVYASLFGVGAPEALVIGVVALLVFGPKGLAEVARNFGKTLRGFQPTIRELQEVSREFKSSLEREIGLDEIDYRVPTNTPKPTSYDTAEDLKTNVESSESKADDSPSESGAYSADEYLKVTEAQLKGALARVQKEQEEEKEKAENQFVSQPPSQDTPQEAENPEASAVQEAASEVLPETPPKPETKT